MLTKEQLLEAVKAAVEESIAKQGPEAYRAFAEVAAARFASGEALKDIGEQFIEGIKGDVSPALADRKNGRVNLGPVAVKATGYGLRSGDPIYRGVRQKTNVLTTMFPSQRTYLPLVELPQRSFRVRDLLPVAGLGTPQIEYARVTGFTASAGGVAEAGTKPESAITTSLITDSVKTVATFIPVSRQALADVSGLAVFINQMLSYFLALEEDDQLLNGSGGSEMTGILNTSGIQTQAVGGEASPAQPKLIAIRKAITKVQTGFSASAGFEPDGIVLNPNDWEDLELLTDTTGRYMLIPAQETVADGGPQPPRVWRLPVVVTPAIVAGTGLVGAFGIGATLWTYEDLVIRVSDSHSDFFIKNLLAVLAEFRELLAVYFPAAFCTVTGL